MLCSEKACRTVVQKQSKTTRAVLLSGTKIRQVNGLQIGSVHKNNLLMMSHVKGGGKSIFVTHCNKLQRASAHSARE